MDYTLQEGEYYKVMEGESMQSYGRLEDGQILSTIHTVIWITEEDYLALEAANNA